MRILAHLLLALVFLPLGACDTRSVSIERITEARSQFSGLSYFLPRGIVELTISRKAQRAGRDIVTLAVGSVRYVADPSHHYSINVNHDMFYSDKITVQVGEDGLLKAILSDSTDQTPDLIKRLVRAPIDIFSEAEKPGTVKDDSTYWPYTKYEIKFTLDPTDPGDRAKLQQILHKVDPTITFSAKPLVRLPAMNNSNHPDCDKDPCFRAAIPYALELISDPENYVATTYSRIKERKGQQADRERRDPRRRPQNQGGRNMGNQNQGNQNQGNQNQGNQNQGNQNQGNQNQGNQNQGNQNQDNQNQGNQNQGNQNQGQNRGDQNQGTRPTDAAVTASSTEEGLVVARAIVVLPNKHAVGQIALTRAPFVQKKFNLSFTNGFLTKAELDNPSEALAFVQIPIDVAKAIVGIPSALFNFQVRQVTDDNRLLQSQKQNLELQRQIIDAQKALLTAAQ